LDISSQVTWNSDNAGIATIDPTGLATGIAAGTANITATISGVTSPAVALKVATLSSIAVTPNSPSNLAVDAAQQFTATATFSDGSTENITSSVTWASSNTAIAIIDYYGVATGIGSGNSNITASLAGVTSPAVSLTVVPATSTTSS
jgi:uncharacterized protein YjdB